MPLYTFINDTSAVATVVATPTRMPATGSPAIPLSPAILLAAGVVGVGVLLRRASLK